MSISKKIQKIPCGGFELGGGLEVKDGKLDLAEDALAIPTLHITVTSLNTKTMETTFTADKTADEMYAVSGPTWCVITVPESISPTGSELVFECSSFKRGPSFGYGLIFNSDIVGYIDFAVVYRASEGWDLNFKYLL